MNQSDVDRLPENLEQPYRLSIVPSSALTAADAMWERIGNGVTRLRSEWGTLLAAFSQLNEVTVVTGDENVLMEKQCLYPKLRHFARCSFCIGRWVDLRLSLGFWHLVFAVSETNPVTGKRDRSLQCFGRDGSLLQKVCLTPKSSLDGFEDLLQQFVDLRQHPERSRPRLFGPIVLQRPSKMGVAYQEQRLSVDHAVRLLHEVATRQIPVILSVGQAACLQLHRGLIARVSEGSGWITARATKMKAHFRDSAMASAWLLLRSFSGSYSATLELRNAAGQSVASISGLFNAGRSDYEWLRLVSEFGGLPALTTP